MSFFYSNFGDFDLDFNLGDLGDFNLADFDM